MALFTGLACARIHRNRVHPGNRPVRVRGSDAALRLPRLGVVAALMLVAMTVEIGLIGYHVNLTVLSGISSVRGSALWRHSS